MTIYYRAADLYQHLDRSNRPELGTWLAYLQTFSLGHVEGKGMATVLDRKAAEYEIRAYCHSPESREAAFAWLDGFEVVSDADLAYIEEVATGIDAALSQDVALWEADDLATDELTGRTYSLAEAEVEWREEVAVMTPAGVAATEVSPFFDGVHDLDVEYDVLRMGWEAVEPLLQRLAGLGGDVVEVRVLRHVGCSVPVYVGSPLPGGGRRFVASQLVADVWKEWQRVCSFVEAVQRP